MRAAVVQETLFGCGVACFAFICNVTFEEATMLLGRQYSVKHGWKPADLVKTLNTYGLSYRSRYVRKNQPTELLEGAIVLIERSDTYPYGHYFVYHSQHWMDPWINMPSDNSLSNARAGYRKTLPGKVMYLLEPQTANARPLAV